MFLKLAYDPSKLGATYTVCNVLHGWSTEQKNEQQSNALNPKKQCSCRLSGSSENRASRSTAKLRFSPDIFVLRK